jgi:hypothetical protein
LQTEAAKKGGRRRFEYASIQPIRVALRDPLLNQPLL